MGRVEKYEDEAHKQRHSGGNALLGSLIITIATCLVIAYIIKKLGNAHEVERKFDEAKLSADNESLKTALVLKYS